MPTPDLVRVATYERRVAASAERVWENVRHWEHLPWLHAASFRSIAPIGADSRGWRARIGLHGGAEIELELAIEPAAPRYVSRTVAGPGAGSEIWTTVTERGPDATDVAVEFWLPGVAPEQRDALGAAFVQLYTRLWDEDEAMMVHRAAQLARDRRPAASHAPLALGPLGDVRRRAPFCFDWAGARWRLVEIDGALHVHATTCPHWLGPLDHAPIEGGAVICPWHGWRFDVATGEAQDGRRARLPAPPAIAVGTDGIVTIAKLTLGV